MDDQDMLLNFSVLQPRGFRWSLWMLMSLLTLATMKFVQADDKLTCENLPASWQADAELTDVFFLNADIGWVVGAQGVILRTTNGGREWKEVGQVDSQQVAQELSFQQKVQAMKEGVRTNVTGIADGRADAPQSYRCRFETVFFIDEKNGWVAGGVDVPYLNHSRGVLLRTADGGATWRRVTGALMPRIHRICFSERSRGWAVGECGKLFKGCLFQTSDSGESWSNKIDPGHHPLSEAYLDADVSERGLVAVDSKGQVILIRNDREEFAVIEGRSRGRLKKIRMLDGRQGWSVGEDGAVWRTVNGGQSWTALDEDPQSPVNRLLREFDFQALAVSPSKVWFAGNPGTQVFSIDRNSGEILSHSTGLSAPIGAMHFVDDNKGWCVGAYGTILATTDSGKTWQRLRGRQRSVAILGIAYDDRELPLEALAKYSSEEDFLMAVALCQTPPTAASQQAMERLGGNGFYSLASRADAQFRQQEQNVQLERLVRLIRTLKPNVLLCDSEYRKLGVGASNQPLAFDPYLLLSAAVKAAADRESYPNQIQLAKLEPWIVDRVAYRSLSGTVSLEPQRMLLRLGHVLEDQIAISRGLIGLSPSTSEKKSYRVEVDSNSRPPDSSDLMDGLSQAGRSVAKRTADTRLRTNRSSIELANRKQQRILELSQFEVGTDQDLIVWHQKIQEWLAPVDEELAGIWLAQLAERYLDQRKTELVARCLELLSTRYYGHALHLPSIAWLARYYSSDEFAKLELDTVSRSRNRLSDAAVAQSEPRNRMGQPATKAYSSTQDGQTILVWAPVAEKIELPKRGRETNLQNELRNDGTTVLPNEQILNDSIPDLARQAENQLATHEEPTSSEAKFLPEGLTAEEVEAFRVYRYRRASQFLNQLNQLDPDLMNDLQVRFLEAGLKRKAGGNSMAEGTLKSISGFNEQRFGFSAAARQELRLMETSSHTIIPDGILSSIASARPYLDGILDDVVWQTISQNNRVVHFASDRAGDKTLSRLETQVEADSDRILFAHDEEFLFIGVVCRKVPGQFYQVSKDTRPRDADLSRRDRVEFCFDLDRDFHSAYRFELDYRGWSTEEMNGARGWNPDWYIARSEDERSWTLEMAIPLANLVSSTIADDEVWAVRLARRLGDGGNLWERNLPNSEEGVSAVHSSGLYQQILARPEDFQLFTFR